MTTTLHRKHSASPTDKAGVSFNLFVMWCGGDYRAWGSVFVFKYFRVGKKKIIFEF